MTAKEYLSKIYKNEIIIQNKLTELEKLKEDVIGISICADKEYIQSSKTKDKMGDMIAKIVDLENEIKDTISTCYDEKQAIIKQLESMNDINYYNILFKRYVANKSVVDISKDMGYSYRHIQRIYNMALAEFEDMYLKSDSK